MIKSFIFEEVRLIDQNFIQLFRLKLKKIIYLEKQLIQKITF
jgi:hypothetical protein